MWIPGQDVVHMIMQLHDLANCLVCDYYNKSCSYPTATMFLYVLISGTYIGGLQFSNLMRAVPHTSMVSTMVTYHIVGYFVGLIIHGSIQKRC